MKNKTIFTIVFVLEINCFIKISCNNFSSDLQNSAINIDKGISAKLNSYHSEGAIFCNKRQLVLVYNRTKINFGEGNIVGDFSLSEPELIACYYDGIFLSDKI